MAHKRDRIVLTPDEQRALLQRARVLHVATIGPSGQPHLAPTWFAIDADGAIVFTTYGKSQKVVNLERDPRITLMAEEGTEYRELRGLSIEARAEVIRDPLTTARTLALTAARLADAEPVEAPSDADLPPQAFKRVTVHVPLEGARVRSWDHRKL